MGLGKEEALLAECGEDHGVILEVGPRVVLVNWIHGVVGIQA